MSILHTDVYQNLHWYEIITGILNVLDRFTSLPLLTAAITVTVLLVKKRKAEA